MRLVRCLALLACLTWAVGCAFAQSQPPSPSPTARDQNQQSFTRRETGKAQEDQRAAKELASAVDKLATEVALDRQEKEREKGEEDSLGHWWSVNATNAIIAFFTMVLVGVGLLQWQTYEEGQKTAKTQLRAYVSFTLNLDNDPIANRDYAIAANCENHGATPALDIGFRAVIWTRPLPLDMANLPEIPDDFDKRTMNLFPGQNMSDRAMGYLADSGTRFTADEIGQVLEGRSAFVIGMKISYTDVFGQSHKTEEFWAIVYEYGNRRRAMLPSKSVIT